MDNAMQCPKCQGTMRTRNRSGVHIEQCDNCRGIFLDYGELESLSQLEAGYAQQQYAPPPPQAPPPPPPPPHGGPGWGAPAPHYGHGYGHGYGRRRGFGRFLFSS
jgi:hypothetical protein